MICGASAIGMILLGSRARANRAPPLAGVATAEGTFSIELDECRIPLDAPERGDLTGRMTVHAVSIGPGPLIR